MDRFECMTILIQVIEQGSFSAASRKLGMPLATVSRKVSELERHLGTKLLLRTTRRVALTDAGTAFVASARQILESLHEIERVAAGEFRAPRGQLVITAPVLFGRLHILPIVADFLAQYQEINVSLLFSDRTLHLIDDHVDMAVRIGELPDSRLVATKVGTMRTVVCASPELLTKYKIPRTPGDLGKFPIVNFGAVSPRSTWSFRGSKDRVLQELSIRPRLSVSTAEAAVWASVNSVGATRLFHYQCAEAVRNKALKLLLKDYEVQPVSVHLVHAARGELPSKMRVFLDFAADRLRKTLISL
jgi:DNA-binding transcriptional LysR family regulator